MAVVDEPGQVASIGFEVVVEEQLVLVANIAAAIPRKTKIEQTFECLLRAIAIDVIDIICLQDIQLSSQGSNTNMTLTCGCGGGGSGNGFCSSKTGLGFG